jgi:7,8-dihydropterin-6-yl-methyl-4-(beta-D-ribofuranosyl)aminobenzene 5'-phosphate synthase
MLTIESYIIFFYNIKRFEILNEKRSKTNMDIGSIESGKVMIKVLTTNEVSLTILPKMNLRDKVKYPGANANSATGEHGLAMIINITDNERSHKILIDTGGLAGGVIENSKQFKVNLSEIDKLILTHGHFDHFGSLAKVIPLLKEGTEFYLNPLCFSQFYIATTKSGEVIPGEKLAVALKEERSKFLINRKLPAFNKAMVSNLAAQYGVKIIETSDPTKLYNGIITSGEIELADKNGATKGFYIMKSRNEYLNHYFKDETSVYLNIKDKGLVVITGCGHCGVINTIKHAQKLTGINKIYAVIGGFHEEWNPIDVIEKKVEFIENLNPEIVCGMHCTGFNFNKIMSRHPSHVIGVTGTEFHL